MGYDAIPNYSDVRFDEQGKPYWTTQSGQRSYLSPAMAAQSPNERARQWAASQGQVYSRDASGRATGVQSNAAPTNTFAHQNNGWNSQTGQFDMGLNQGGLGGLLEGAAAVAGPTLIGPAIAGIGGGTGTVAPGVVNLSTPASTAAAAPYAAGAATASTSAGAAGGWEALKRSLNSPADFAKLIPLLPAIRAAAGGGSPTGGDSSGLIDDVRQSLAQQRDRMTQAQPVYDALIRQAMGTTPTRYRAGAQPTNGGAGYAYTPPTFGGR